MNFFFYFLVLLLCDLVYTINILGVIKNKDFTDNNLFFLLKKIALVFKNKPHTFLQNEYIKILVEKNKP